jgi:hypothetical protein
LDSLSGRLPILDRPRKSALELERQRKSLRLFGSGDELRTCVDLKREVAEDHIISRGLLIQDSHFLVGKYL